jgi:hypothetical protein
LLDLCQYRWLDRLSAMNDPLEARKDFKESCVGGLGGGQSFFQ